MKTTQREIFAARGKITLRESKRLTKDEANVEQIIGREGETATLFGTSSVTFQVVAGGFAPRQLNRSALRG